MKLPKKARQIFGNLSDEEIKYITSPERGASWGFEALKHLFNTSECFWDTPSKEEQARVKTSVNYLLAASDLDLTRQWGYAKELLNAKEREC